MLSNVHKTTAGHNGATDENAVKVDGNEVTTVYSTRLGAIFVGQEDEETFFTPGERIKIVNYRKLSVLDSLDIVMLSYRRQ